MWPLDTGWVPHFSDSSSLLLILFSISGHLSPDIRYCILQCIYTYKYLHVLYYHVLEAICVPGGAVFCSFV